MAGGGTVHTLVSRGGRGLGVGRQEVAPGVAGGIEAGSEPGGEGEVRGEWVGPGQTH